MAPFTVSFARDAHLFNHSNKEIIIEKNEKISQFIIVPCWSDNPKFVENIDENTSRGLGGFGSTGLK